MAFPISQELRNLARKALSELKGTKELINKATNGKVLNKKHQNLAQSFGSKIPSAENLLVQQLGRYIFYPRDK